ncbi:MAG: hypothetical protein IJX26_03865, partial [Clostridia bacterium]|nr:hypothetical protein [Clostridia bacterium]
MSDKPKVKFKWLEKLKNVKHIEIIIIVIFAIVIFLIYNSSFKSSSKGGGSSSYEEYSGEVTITQYVSNLENNLEKTLSNIKGVSNVNVMITLDMKDMIIE